MRLIMLILIIIPFITIASCCKDLPILDATKTFAPNIPPPITRSYPALLRLHLNASVVRSKLDAKYDYDFWAYDERVPGPIIRARIGDRLEVTLSNSPSSGIAHNINFHSVIGPGGGASVLTVEPGRSVTATFQLLHTGFFLYHCAVEPTAHHIANGMYGLILVEPTEGLAKVDREFVVVRSEFYTQKENDSLLKVSYQNGLDEKPSHVVLNGRVGSLVENPLMAKTDERLRIFYANIGPNQVASYHMIGIIFDKVYREGDLISPPARSLQTTMVPPGGTTVVEFTTPVPGSYAIVDHSLFRLLKGAVGYLDVTGPPRLDVYCPNNIGDNATCCRQAESTFYWI